MSENSRKDHHNRRRGNRNTDSPSHIAISDYTKVALKRYLYQSGRRIWREY